MTQTVLAYLLTAIAAVWVAWAVALPRSLKKRLKAPFVRSKAAAGGKGGCGDGCGCGD